MRFESVRSEYIQKKKMLETIQELRKGKPLYDDMPKSLHPFFLEQAKKQRRIDYK